MNADRLLLVMLFLLPGTGQIVVPAQESGQQQYSEIIQEEADRILRLLDLGSGDTVADVGAGDGYLAIPLARRLRDQGMVIATEVEPDLVNNLKELALKDGLENLTVVLGNQSKTGLDESCCAAILLRLVYHHMDDRHVMRNNLMAALKPGGLIAVIEPHKSPQNRHHFLQSQVIEEMTANGFKLVREIEDWVQAMHCTLLRKPISSPD